MFDTYIRKRIMEIVHESVVFPSFFAFLKNFAKINIQFYACAI